MIGSQSGSVMSATSTSPGWNWSICASEVITRTGPAPIFCPIARPTVITVPRLVEHEAAHDVAVGPRDDGLGPSLQDVQLAVDAVLAPLDVHRTAVVVLDGQRLPGEFLDLGVGDAELRALRERRHR